MKRSLVLFGGELELVCSLPTCVIKWQFQNEGAGLTAESSYQMIHVPILICHTWSLFVIIWTTHINFFFNFNLSGIKPCSQWHLTFFGKWHSCHCLDRHWLKSPASELSEWGSVAWRKIPRSQWSTALLGTKWLPGHGWGGGKPGYLATFSKQESQIGWLYRKAISVEEFSTSCF